jgi:diaminohydroxyphosphoribosylaminopyrimidine deaminase/5-amino-6-(5-phosphoribosylamino)uracil reductase
MAIDLDTAWSALLRARDAWRPGAALAPLHFGAAPEGGAALHLRPEGIWQAPAIAPAAAALLDLYLPLLRPRLALGQLGQSLDGRIATASGHSHYVTGPESLVHLHRLRALCDAVVVGAGTVAADDPQLTVRRCRGANPLRVVLDPRRGLAAQHRVFVDGQAPTLVLGAVPVEAPGQAEAATLPLDPDGGFAPAAVLAFLAARGCARVLVEGGGITVSRFLAAAALDRLHLVVAPLVIGSGRSGLTLPPIDRLDQALRPRHRRIALGDDMLFDLALR